MNRLFVSVIAIAMAGSSAAWYAATSEGAGPAPESEAIAAIRLLLEENPALAEGRARALLEATESAKGADSLEVAAVLDVLVEVLLGQGNTDEATVALARRALAIKAERLAEDDVALVSSLSNLGELLRLNSEYDEAGAHLQRAIDIVATVKGADHPDLGPRLLEMGRLRWSLSQNQEALEDFGRALALKEKEVGNDDPTLAPYVYGVAVMLRRLGRFEDAQPVYERALELAQSASEPDPDRISQARNGLGVNAWELGDYVRARSEFEKVLEIRIDEFGEDSLEAASTLNNLGRLLTDTGDYESARQHHERALAIRRGRLNPDHRLIAQSLHNLGTLLVAVEDYSVARAHLKRALDIRIKLYGEVDTRVANTLRSLARLYSRTGNLAEAESLYRRAVGILRELEFTDDPEYAWNLEGLGPILERQGDLASAIEIYREVLGIRRDTLGSLHPFIAGTTSDLARALARSGQDHEALERALLAEQLSRDHLVLTASTLPEREALRYAVVRSSGLDVALSLLVDEPDAASVERVWDALIRSRALILDEMAARHRATVRPSDPEIAALHGELDDATSELARLVVRGPAGDPDAYREEWERARQRRERAERKLAERSRPFRAELSIRTVGLERVAEQLPSGSALVAFVLYEHYDLDVKRTEPTPSYAAFILRPGDPRSIVQPLGPVERINREVVLWKGEASEGLRRPGRSTAQAENAYIDAAAKLRSTIWDPLQPHLGDVERVFIVPDAALNLVSFYALADRNGRFLLEDEVLVHYLAAERDLVRFDDARAAGNSLLAIGGADYDTRLPFSALSNQQGTAASATADGTYRGEHSACPEFSTRRFSYLPETEREAREIARLWGRDSSRSALRLFGKDATEAAFKREAPGRHVVHLATHGFFLGSTCAPATRGARGIGRLSAETQQPQGPVGGNPLLLSGLVLAGANHREAATGNEEDGILTAEEIAAMNLSSVEWAVLSACDTGVGEIQAGEGVFGLRRAFQVAGASTTIMSLWSVGDAATRSWMRALYEARLNEGLDSVRAVREASLRLLKESRKAGSGSHPFSWGGWVAAGDYR